MLLKKFSLSGADQLFDEPSGRVESGMLQLDVRNPHRDIAGGTLPKLAKKLKNKVARNKPTWWESESEDPIGIGGVVFQPLELYRRASLMLLHELCTPSEK